MSITAIIAPVEAIATSPKLSFSENLLSFFKFEIPTAIAKINGTVSAPVVAPEASKDIAINSEEAKMAIASIIPYNTASILYKALQKIEKMVPDYDNFLVDVFQ